MDGQTFSAVSDDGMKMAKATQTDIDAAGDAMSVLNDISSGYYPARNDEEDAPTFFDPDEFDHLRKFYDLMMATLEKSHGWPGRVIGGMCFVILYDENQIVDPDADTLEHHPRAAACIAACEGIDTADLKAGSVSIIHKLHDEAAQRVLAQRDELLAALNMLKAADFGANVKTADDERHMDSVAEFARAAIAKVEGGA